MNGAVLVQAAGAEAAGEPLPLAALLLGLIAMAMGMAMLPVARGVFVALVPKPAEARVGWGLLHVVNVIGVGLLAMVASALLLGSADGLAILVATTLIMGVVALACSLWAGRCDGDALGAMGLRQESGGRSVFGSVACYVLLLPLVLGTVWVWPQVLEWCGLAIERQEVLNIILGLGGGELLLAGLLAVVLIPLFEELVFRSFLQPVLVQNMGARAGLVMTALLFAILHGPIAFGPVFVLALILGGIRQFSPGVLGSWAVHSVHNALTLVIAWVVQSYAGDMEIISFPTLP